MNPGIEISIVIPHKNCFHLLLQAIESVKAQNFRFWELIIVDDHSTDAIPNQLENAIQNRPITFVSRLSQNGGASACRNTGIRLSRGNYLIFLDADDLLSNTCLSKRFAFMEENPNLLFGAFGCAVFREMPGDTKILWNIPKKENDLDRYLKLDHPWQTSSLIWKKEAFHIAGEWDEQLPSMQDYDLAVRALSLKLPYMQSNITDCFWRLPSPNSIGQHALTPDHLEMHERLYSRIHIALTKNNLLTPQRKKMLAGLFFWTAKAWIRNQRFSKARQTWEKAYQFKLIATIYYRLGELILALSKSAFISARLLRKFLEGASSLYRLSFSSTFRKVARA